MCFADNLKGKVGKPCYLEKWLAKPNDSDVVFNVTFDWDEEIGVPGAIIVKNEHHHEFYLKTVTLHDVPRHDKLHFICNSWVYPTKYNDNDRIFFTNKVFSYLSTLFTHRVYNK